MPLPPSPATVDASGKPVVRRLLVEEVALKFQGRHWRVDSPIPVGHPSALPRLHALAHRLCLHTPVSYSAHQ